jgi:hypothetical protein
VRSAPQHLCEIRLSRQSLLWIAPCLDRYDNNSTRPRNLRCPLHFPLPGLVYVEEVLK